MAERRTEAHHRNAEGLDIQAPEAILSSLASAQVDAAGSVQAAIPQIAAAAGLVAARLKAGGRLVYAAAGSSGLMALADALELPGTFGIARDRVVVLLAGGDAALKDLAGAPEDDVGEAKSAVAQAGVGAGDCLIALSASGSTPYAIAAVEEARRRGAATIALANNRAAPLLEKADVGILLETPPEVIAGSTRMGAGTAQKAALGILSSLVMIRLGRVHDGLMVDLRIDNEKLRRRAVAIVMQIAGCGAEAAAVALEAAGDSVKLAVLVARGATPARARDLVAAADGNLRKALALLRDAGAAQTRAGDPPVA